MVKVADVGVTRHENAESGEICSPSMYVAPEVFENRINNSKADMYSFGYVLWELWYGITAFRGVFDSGKDCNVLADVVKQDLQPTHIKGTQHPWGIWQYVMASCWNKDPKLRLTAQTGWEQLQNFNISLPPPLPTEPSSPPPPPLPPRLSTLSPPPLPPRSSSLRQEPPTKQRPAWPWKPKGNPIWYRRETEDGKVHFEKERIFQLHLRHVLSLLIVTCKLYCLNPEVWNNTRARRRHNLDIRTKQVWIYFIQIFCRICIL